MSRITNIAAMTGLLAVLAGPALAGDQDTLTLLRDSGRYVPEAGMPGPYIPAPPFKGILRVPGAARDFQMEGR